MGRTRTKLYISSKIGSARYPKTLWNYDDAAADTYPFLFWAAYHTDPERLWGTHKLEANTVRTVLIHTMLHTRNTIARPWRQSLQLGAAPVDEGICLFMKSDQAYEGRMQFDIPRHRLYQGFKQDWPRMNAVSSPTTPQPIMLDKPCIMMHHQRIMRTTLTIADELLIEAKRLAAERRCSVSEVVNSALRSALKRGTAQEGPKVPFEMPTYGRKGHGKAPAISPAGMAALVEEDDLAPYRSPKRKKGSAE
jgi:Arc/MetJ family transcription regulator